MATTSAGFDRSPEDRRAAQPSGSHEFARRVRDGRRALNLTQEELAARAGIGVRTVRTVEAGRSVPRPDTVRRITAALEPERVSLAGEPGTVRIPAQLPPAGGPFVGRAEELARLDDLLLPRLDGSAGGIVVLSGTAGVGKTALALRWAHRSGADFPDGQLFADLRGYDPEEPARPLAILAAFLRELDPDAEPPHDLGACSARFRTVTADRTFLLVLDNASSEEQVRPLLPGSATCRTLITSRDTLPGLVARDGATRVEVDLLPAPDALELLRAVLPDRVATESGAGRARGSPSGISPWRTASRAGTPTRWRPTGRRSGSPGRSASSPTRRTRWKRSARRTVLWADWTRRTSRSAARWTSPARPATGGSRRARSTPGVR